ncbi:hypothetical protein FRB99_000035 [Tulasnella sp. 403]|nr:hypothetical protein FRB99_000035 [Tulasnella sp. 403]
MSWRGQGFDLAAHSIRRLEGVPVVERKTLADTWPNTIFGTFLRVNAAGGVVPHEQEAKEDVRSRCWLQICFRKAMTETAAFRSAVDSQYIHQSASQTAYFPEQCMPIVLRALEIAYETGAQDPTALDLSGCNKLTSDQVIRIVSRYPGVASLDLSRNPNVTTETLMDIVRSRRAPLKELILFNTPGLECHTRLDMDALKASGAFKGTKVFYTGWLLEIAVARMAKTRFRQTGPRNKLGPFHGKHEESQHLLSHIKVGHKQHNLTDRPTKPSYNSQTDLVQDLYLRELKSYKPPVQAKDAHVGNVKAYAQPSAPKPPILPGDLASELAAYDAQEPIVETPTSTAVAGEGFVGGAEAFLAHLEADIPKEAEHH